MRLSSHTAPLSFYVNFWCCFFFSPASFFCQLLLQNKKAKKYFVNLKLLLFALLRFCSRVAEALMQNNAKVLHRCTCFVAWQKEQRSKCNYASAKQRKRSASWWNTWQSKWKKQTKDQIFKIKYSRSNIQKVYKLSDHVGISIQLQNSICFLVNRAPFIVCGDS